MQNTLSKVTLSIPSPIFFQFKECVGREGNKKSLSKAVSLLLEEAIHKAQRKDAFTRAHQLSKKFSLTTEEILSSYKNERK